MNGLNGLTQMLFSEAHKLRRFRKLNSSKSAESACFPITNPRVLGVPGG